MSQNATETIETLHQQLVQKDHEIANLKNQIALLVEKNKALSEQVNDTQAMAHNLRNVSSSVDDLLNMFMDSQHQRLSQPEKPTASAVFLESVELQNDKELLFGINIKQEFLSQSSASTIKYYLFACQCNVREEFEITNLKIDTKEQLALVGEAFAQYVRLASLSEGHDIQGIIEALSGTIIDPPVLKYYGDKTAARYFHDFVLAYSTSSTTDIQE